MASRPFDFIAPGIAGLADSSAGMSELLDIYADAYTLLSAAILAARRISQGYAGSSIEYALCGQLEAAASACKGQIVSAVITVAINRDSVPAAPRKPQGPRVLRPGE